MLFFNKNRTQLSQFFSIKKLGKTSNASKNITKLKFHLPLQLKYPRLLLRKKWLSGRSNNGSITVFSKGPRAKKRLPLINYSYRNNSLYFIAGLNYVNYNTKLTSLIFNSTGQVSYIPSKLHDCFFKLIKSQPLIPKVSSPMSREVLVFKPYIYLDEIPYMLIQQKKNSSISFLESWPGIGVKYTRSFGSTSKIIKLDTRTGLSLVQLSSGIKKIFSAFSLSNKGHANLYILKNRFRNTKSGDQRKRGLKSIVRGVAMNPVDHPHGGRTNSIKYPRTPWGKTTKYK